MASTVEKVAADALRLPSDGRAFLVETLLESLSGETDAAIEMAHLAEIRLRREAVRSGKAKLNSYAQNTSMSVSPASSRRTMSGANNGPSFARSAF